MSTTDAACPCNKAMRSAIPLFYVNVVPLYLIWWISFIFQLGYMLLELCCDYQCLCYSCWQKCSCCTLTYFNNLVDYSIFHYQDKFLFRYQWPFFDVIHLILFSWLCFSSRTYHFQIYHYTSLDSITDLETKIQARRTSCKAAKGWNWES